MNGEPLNAEYAFLDPQAKEGKKPWKVEKRKSIFDWTDDFLLFIEDIESQFSKKDRITKVSGKDGVILVGVGTKGKVEALSSIEELARLADTAGLQVLGRQVQIRRKIDSKLVKRKIKDILIEAMQKDADALVFDQELTPSQLRNIATATNIKVIDPLPTHPRHICQTSQNSRREIARKIAQPSVIENPDSRSCPLR